MKQIVFGVFLIAIVCFIGLFGYTRRLSLSMPQTLRGQLVPVSCHVVPLGRRFALQCVLERGAPECGKLNQGACPSMLPDVIVSQLIGQQISQKLVLANSVQARLIMSQGRGAKISQIYIDSQPVLPHKQKRE